MQSHKFFACPWAKVAADLLEFDNRVLLVVCDYHSNFIEVVGLSSITSRAIIKELKAIFARLAFPDTLVTHNGLQFLPGEFSVFSRTWMFEHKTSSPAYPQSNGKAETAVKIVQNFFAKCKAAGASEFQALLDWHNTPTAGIGTSPTQCLMGRSSKTLLPVAGSLLQPNFPTEEDTRKLIGTKQRQQHYYNKQAKPLEPISVGVTVRMRLPGEKTWSSGARTDTAGPRSYWVQVGQAVYRRNRRQLIKTGESNNVPELIVPDRLAEASPEAETTVPPGISPRLKCTLDQGGRNDK